MTNLASFLVRGKQRVVAVDACRNAGPNAFTIVTVLDEALAARKSILHGLALSLIKNCRPSTVAARHWLVIFVLGQAVGKAIPNEDGLQIDVAVLMGEDLRGKDRNVVASVRFTSDVEVLLRVFWELLEE